MCFAVLDKHSFFTFSEFYLNIQWVLQSKDGSGILSVKQDRLLSNVASENFIFLEILGPTLVLKCHSWGILFLRYVST